MKIVLIVRTECNKIKENSPTTLLSATMTFVRLGRNIHFMCLAMNLILSPPLDLTSSMSNSNVATTKNFESVFFVAIVYVDVECGLQQINFTR